MSLATGPRGFNHYTRRAILKIYRILYKRFLKLDDYTKNMLNISFYKYLSINNPKEFKTKYLDLCRLLELKGKIILAKEGINGSLSGTYDNISLFINKIKENKRFADIDFKISQTSKHTFKKLFVKIKKEIITSSLENIKLNPNRSYIEPAELKKLLDLKEDLKIIDVRNKYETKIGKFKGALTLDIEEFSQFQKAVKKLDHLKEDKVIIYCTGGVRCEKALAYMQKQGFKDINQLHGGIINYGQTVGDNYWEGKCFVFDRRGAINIDINKQTEPPS